MKIKFFILTIFSIMLASAMHAQKDSLENILKLSELSLDELMNVQVVTASGYLQTTSEAPSTINVITAQQIKERGYEELADALRDIPGIDMIHLNGYAPTLIYFRGMYGAENLRALLMIDGIAENNIIGSNDMAGPAYSLHNVERIEIIWGPASALYGANAFGGVINIITKKGESINGFQAEKGFGSFNTSFEKILFGIKKSNWEIAAAGSLYSTDGPKFTNRDPNYTASYVDKAYSFNTTVSYSFKRSKTTLGFRTYNTPMGWGTFFNSPTVFLGLPSQGYGNSGVLGLIARDVRDERSGLEEPFSRTVFLQQDSKLSNKLSLMARATFRETGISDRSYAYITLDGKKLIRVITQNYSRRISGEVSANYTPSENQNFSAGIQFYSDNVERGSRGSTIDTNTVYLIDGRFIVTNLYSTFKDRLFDIRNTFGSYLQYALNTNLLGKTNFTAGLRYDYNDYYQSNFSPRIAIVNKPNDKLTFKLQFGKAYRPPTNTEIYQAPLNLKLKSEKITTYEANVIYSLSRRTALQVNVFRNELRDVIILGNLLPPTPDKNPGLINVNGIETKLDMLFTTNFSAFANFTYQNARGENLITLLRRDVPDVAKVKGNAGITLKVEDLFTLNIIGNWIGRRTSPLTDPYGPVEGYFLTNCVISTQRLFNKRITASLNIRNIFNTKWLDPGFRSADGFIYSTVLDQPGRTGLFKIGVNF